MKLASFVLAATLGMHGAVSAEPAHHASQRPCARLDLEFFPRRVEPRQLMDTGFALSNCAAFTERLVVVLTATGPCPFTPSSRDAYVLGPMRGFGASGLTFAPPCGGHYKLKGKVSFRGRVLDRATAAFTVVRRGRAVR
jgi:hypothetical protein